MKRYLILLCLALALLAGCHKNPARELMDKLSTEPRYVGAYLQIDDVLRVGHGLDTAEDDAPVKWENRDTGYQYSMIVFDTVRTGLTTTRGFSLLSIDQAGQGEVLNLRGVSTGDRIWSMVATKPASAIGTVGRMDLPPTPSPRASLTSDREFQGFVVEE